MNKKRWAVYVGLLLVLMVFTAVFVYGNNTNPGSETDPLVSKSYVDSKTTFAPLALKAGEKLIGKSGTQVILRSGEATAIDNGQNGVSDLTTGTDLRTGNKVGQNHLLLIPREDGRGIAATTEVWVMVMGSYTITN